MNRAPAFGHGSSTYALGAFDERRRLEHEQRVAAFGAMRRAAAIARHHDCEARIIACGSTDFAKRLADEHLCLARAIRRVIRAAIGSADA